MKVVKLNLTGEQVKELAKTGETVKALGGVGYKIAIADGELKVVGLVPLEAQEVFISGQDMDYHKAKKIGHFANLK